MAWIPFLTAVAAAIMAPGGPPDRVDLQIAQVRWVHSTLGEDGMVHCSRFRSFRAERTTNPDVYRVSYREYREMGSWPSLRAVLRREGDEWIWVEGDPPKCSITIISE